MAGSSPTGSRRENRRPLGLLASWDDIGRAVDPNPPIVSAMAPDLRRRPTPEELSGDRGLTYPGPVDASEGAIRYLKEILQRPDISDRERSLIKGYIEDYESGRDRLLSPGEGFDGDRLRFYNRDIELPEELQQQLDEENRKREQKQRQRDWKFYEG